MSGTVFGVGEVRMGWVEMGGVGGARRRLRRWMGWGEGKGVVGMVCRGVVDFEEGRTSERTWNAVSPLRAGVDIIFFAPTELWCGFFFPVQTRVGRTASERGSGVDVVGFEVLVLDFALFGKFL